VAEPNPHAGVPFTDDDAGWATDFARGNLLRVPFE
jgi:hypothetical protein